MGLDTTPRCWEGSCSGFHRWRNTIAEAAGYPLVEVDRRYGRVVLADVGDAQYTEEHARGDWDAPPDDILFVLLVHSDCDGHIHPEHAGPLADRLEKLIPAVDALGAGSRSWEVEPTREFVAGLREAAASNRRVEFH